MTPRQVRKFCPLKLMAPCHTFARGPESLYRIAEEAYNRRNQFLAFQRRRFAPKAVARRILQAFSLTGKSVSATRTTA